MSVIFPCSLSPRHDLERGHAGYFELRLFLEVKNKRYLQYYLYLGEMSWLGHTHFIFASQTIMAKGKVFIIFFCWKKIKK